MTNARLPNADRAFAPERKVREYLLSEAHPDGRGKARFFVRHGFSASEWSTLAEALQHHAGENPLIETVKTAFGVRFVVEGRLHSPDGRTPIVRTVWFIDRDGGSPRLVTAYPIQRRPHHDP